MFDLLRERGLTPAVWVSTGNQVDVDVTEVARHLLHDPAVDIILVYVEQTPDGAAWDALGRAAQDAGKADRGAASGRDRRRAGAAMLSHTGALVGERRPFELTSQANAIVMVDDLEPMIDSRWPVTVARTGRGGGWRSSPRRAEPEASPPTGASGAACRSRRSPPATRDAVDELLPAFASSVNPIDVTGMFVRPGPSRMGELCAVVSNDRNVDHMLLVLTNTVGEAALAACAVGGRRYVHADGIAAERRVSRFRRPHGDACEHHDRRRHPDLPRGRAPRSAPSARSRFLPTRWNATGRRHDPNHRSR